MLYTLTMINAVLSQIKLLETGLICPFEWQETDQSSGDLSIEDINLIRNPFPVVPLEDGNYLLLDDADLYRFLAESDLRHLPVQVLSPENVTVTSEHLALVGFERADLINLIARDPNQIVPGGKSTPCPEGYVPIKFDFVDADPQTVFFRHSSRIGCPLSIQILFRDILNRGEYSSAVDHRELHDVVVKVPSPSALVTLPPFSLAEMQSAAVSDRLFPPGFLRPSTNSRIVSIDFPLSVLRSDISGEEKESFLRELIVFRNRNRRTSCYTGQVFILNR